jgi:hypothetical protein
MSVEISLPKASVVIPSTISLSLTFNSLTAINAVVPPIVILPPT